MRKNSEIRGPGDQGTLICYYSCETGPSHDLLKVSVGSKGIYTLSGMRLQTTDVDHLPSGIYVVNGNKIVK